MKKQRGSSLIESALVITTYFILVMAIIDFARLGFFYNSIAYAAHRGARWAAVRGNTSGHAANQSDVQAQVQGNLVGVDPSSLTVGVAWSPNNSPGSQVQVKVTYRFQPILAMIAPVGIRLQSTSDEVIME